MDCSKDVKDYSASTPITLSVDSVEIYLEKLKPCIDASLSTSNAPLQELVREAEQVVSTTFAPHASRTYTFKTYGAHSLDEISVELDNVISAMLSHIGESGGERGQRYVASAIMACTKQEDVVRALRELGTVWLQFLFIFRVEDRPHPFPTRERSFSRDLLLRDGYKCVVTGNQHESHPALDKPVRRRNVELCRILRQTFGGALVQSKYFKSACVAQHILEHITVIPLDVFRDVDSTLDDPSNGMLLEFNASLGFMYFDWCLKSTTKENEYEIRVFNKTRVHFPPPPNNRITFRDLSPEFSLDSSQRPVALPDPRYLAFHSAIAEIMATGSIGKFFERILWKYPNVASWPDLEDLIEKAKLRDSIADIFKTVDVH